MSAVMDDSDEIEAMQMEIELIELMTGLSVDDLEDWEGMAEPTRQQPILRVH
jgi:hypothetical protein